MSTLSERIKEAIETSGVTVSAVATACGISVQAVYQWMNGETKTIDGSNLVELAEVTGFDPRWIAREIPPKIRRYARTPQQDHVLKSMQTMPAPYADMVVKIVDTVAESKPGSDDGGSQKAA